MVVWKINEKNYFFYIFFFSNLQASTVYDYETNIFFKEIIDSIAKVNNFNKNVSFIVILDDRPNAFVTENNNIIISSGLIKFSNSYEAIVGVLAHEIGHIDKFHVTKRKQSIEDLTNLNNLTNISILAGSLISNNSEYIFQSLIGNKLSIHNYFQSFSREQEREADFYAINTLAKLNLSTKPLKDLLNRLEKDATKKGIKDEFYRFSSHPIYKERYEIINNTDNYQIISKSSGELLSQGSSQMITSYNILTHTFATLIAEKDARKRAVREISADITNKITIFFRLNKKKIKDFKWGRALNKSQIC